MFFSSPFQGALDLLPQLPPQHEHQPHEENPSNSHGNNDQRMEQDEVKPSSATTLGSTSTGATAASNTTSGSSVSGLTQCLSYTNEDVFDDDCNDDDSCQWEAIDLSRSSSVASIEDLSRRPSPSQAAAPAVDHSRPAVSVLRSFFERTSRPVFPTTSTCSSSSPVSSTLPSAPIPTRTTLVVVTTEGVEQEAVLQEEEEEESQEEETSNASTAVQQEQLPETSTSGTHEKQQHLSSSSWLAVLLLFATVALVLSRGWVDTVLLPLSTTPRSLVAIKQKQQLPLLLDERIPPRVVQLSDAGATSALEETTPNDTTISETPEIIPCSAEARTQQLDMENTAQTASPASTQQTRTVSPNAPPLNELSQSPQTHQCRLVWSPSLPWSLDPMEAMASQQCSAGDPSPEEAIIVNRLVHRQHKRRLLQRIQQERNKNARTELKRNNFVWTVKAQPSPSQLDQTVTTTTQDMEDNLVQTEDLPPDSDPRIPEAPMDELQMEEALDKPTESLSTPEPMPEKIAPRDLEEPSTEAVVAETQQLAEADSSSLVQDQSSPVETTIVERETVEDRLNHHRQRMQQVTTNPWGSKNTMAQEQPEGKVTLPSHLETKAREVSEKLQALQENLKALEMADNDNSNSKKKNKEGPMKRLMGSIQHQLQRASRASKKWALAARKRRENRRRTATNSSSSKERALPVWTMAG